MSEPTQPPSKEMVEKARIATAVAVAWSRLLVNLIRSVSVANHANEMLQTKPDLGNEIIRLCVVMLHAALEDFMRTIARHMLPHMDGPSLDKIKYPGKADEEDRPKVLTIAELARYRDRTVADVIDMAVESYCSRLTINDTNDLNNLLTRLRLPIDQLKEFYTGIGWLMGRRHQIAHEADFLNVDPSKGIHLRAFAADVSNLSRSFQTLRDFGEAVAKAISPVLLVHHAPVVVKLHAQLEALQSDDRFWSDVPQDEPSPAPPASKGTPGGAGP